MSFIALPTPYLIFWITIAIFFGVIVLLQTYLIWRILILLRG